VSPVHGGDLDAVARRYGADPASLIDFSANISPFGPPAGVARVLVEYASRPRALAPYPGVSYERLRTRIAERLRIEPEAVVIGHGSAGLIEVALRAETAPTWFVPVPAFSEYRRALRAVGVREQTFALPGDFALDVDAFLRSVRACGDAGALVNTPHNPSGTALERERALALVEGFDRLKRPLIVDEAFIDYAPERSIAREAVRTRHAIVLHSLTKFYALAGVRVGYALAHADTARRMRETGASWPIGSLDEAIVFEALADEAYARQTRLDNERERVALRHSLIALGLHVIPSVANFLLVELALPAERLDVVIDALIQERVIVRDCRSYEGLERRATIRVAVLDGERNRILVNALARVVRLFQRGS
jgi:threonine-phosphate decarboxylase